MASAVEQKVKQIIVEQLGVDESQVDNKASFVDDLGADSLDIVELVMAFEEAFELESPTKMPKKSPRLAMPLPISKTRKSNPVRGIPVFSACISSDNGVAGRTACSLHIHPSRSS